MMTITIRSTPAAAQPIAMGSIDDGSAAGGGDEGGAAPGNPHEIATKGGAPAAKKPPCVAFAFVSTSEVAATTQSPWALGELTTPIWPSELQFGSWSSTAVPIAVRAARVAGGAVPLRHTLGAALAESET